LVMWEIVKNRIKMAVRSKELYIYVIGFPLMFMIIYGSIAPTYYSTVETLHIGFLTEDLGITYELGNNTYFENYSDIFYEYLDALYYESQSIKVFTIENISTIEEAEKKASKLDVAGVIHLPRNFSTSLYNSSASMTYNILMPIIVDRMNEEFEKGNVELATRYLEALEELSQFANKTFSVTIFVIGDPTYSKAMQLYELAWKYVANFVFQQSRKFARKYANYLEEKYNITIPVDETTGGFDVEKSFNIQFRRIGGKSARETFLQMYYSILIPGQMIQSVMIASVSAIYMIGYEMRTRILQRLKLTKVRSAEYIGGTLLAWGIVSLFLGTILLAIAIGLGYVQATWSFSHILISVLILVLAGILTAAYSLIFLSFTNERIAGTFSLITLIMISLFIAGYFPIPNPVLGEIMGREFTLFDIVPWRSAITGLRKSLVLTQIYEPIDVLPDIVLLLIWTTIYSVISFAAFDKLRLKKRE